ncbi:hypothetical protein ABT304_06075 [Nocardioides sp. NPDC000445]|uniref:hypothetical protein n=1 Tax=Nocardioides sp. NPDC000445 TaxID=3154257 RepID=UPI00332E82BD
MGRWGAIMYYPSERSPKELYPDQTADPISGCVAGWSAWDFGRHLPDDFDRTIAATFGVPLLSAEVWDSDAACLTFIGHEAPWQTVLHLDAYVGYVAEVGYVPFYADGTPMSEEDEAKLAAADAKKFEVARERLAKAIPLGSVAAERATLWARAVGLNPLTVEQATAAFDGEDVFVEDTLWEVAKALGVLA